MHQPIYLDNQSTTPLDPAVLKSMLPFFQNKYGNAASVHHAYGREAKEAVEMARRIIASELNAQRREIIFTSGATESINLAIRGICDQQKEKGRHLITQVTEHKAVLDTCAAMEKQGWEVTYLPVDETGRVDPDAVMESVRTDTVLVAIMHANNEIGTIQPVSEIGAICHSKNTFFLVDACQSFGKLPIDVEEMNIDLLAATGHKIYGPKGIGMLFARQKDPRIKLTIQLEGGGHERGMRSGLEKYRDQMIDEIISAHPKVILNGLRKNRLAHNINLCFTGLDAETLITKMKGIACSTGSACSSANLEPSHVLKALGHDNEMSHSAIRFSLGRFNTPEEIQKATREIIDVVSDLEKKLPRHQHINN